MGYPGPPATCPALVHFNQRGLAITCILYIYVADHTIYISLMSWCSVTFSALWELNISFCITYGNATHQNLPFLICFLLQSAKSSITSLQGGDICTVVGDAGSQWSVTVDSEEERNIALEKSM